MEQKVRFKLHKVKKNWVTIGVNASKTMKMAFLWFSLMEAED